jgi:hypothetical protein
MLILVTRLLDFGPGDDVNLYRKFKKSKTNNIMKTTSQTTRSFPKPIRFSLYVSAVVVLCFFNWVALQAQAPSKSLEISLADALVEEVEAEAEIEPWMLTFSEDYLANVETEITLEPWMLSFSKDYIADRESEIEIESWMLTFSDEYLVLNEAEIAVEDWMTSTFIWDTVYLLARK